MRIHPRLASLLFSLIVFLIFGLLNKKYNFPIAIVIIVIILTSIIGTIIYSHLLKKYDDEDMII